MQPAVHGAIASLVGTTSPVVVAAWGRCFLPPALDRFKTSRVIVPRVLLEDAAMQRPWRQSIVFERSESIPTRLVSATRGGNGGDGDDGPNSRGITVDENAVAELQPTAGKGPTSWSERSLPTGGADVAHALRCPARYGTFRRPEGDVPLTVDQRSPYPLLAAAVLLVSHVADPAGPLKILVTKRSAALRAFPSTWVFPGGGVDEGETLEEAAAREVREEVGLAVDPNALQFVGVWESCFPVEPTAVPPKRHHVVFYFQHRLGRPLEPSEVSLQATECTEWKWIGQSEMQDLPSRRSDGADNDNNKGTRESGDVVLTEGTAFMLQAAFQRFSAHEKRCHATKNGGPAVCDCPELPAEATIVYV